MSAGIVPGGLPDHHRQETGRRGLTAQDDQQILWRSAHLVKLWGGTRLPDGQTLAEMLTLQGISLWDAAAVELALYHVPPAIRGERSLSRVQQFRSYFSRARYKVWQSVRLRKGATVCVRWPRQPAFLFLGFSPYMYRDVLEPVAAQIEAGPEFSAVVLHDDRALPTAASREGGRRFQSIWDHWDNGVQLQAQQLRQTLNATMAELRQMGGLAPIINDQGRPLWHWLKDRFHWLFRVSLPQLLPHLAIAWHILQKHRPALIVSPDVADPRTRLYCLLGRQLGIPSLEMQFGMYGPASVEWQFFTADRLAVWGEKSKQVLMEHGVPAERMELSGSPRYDTLAHVSAEEVSMTRDRLGLPPDQAMVLFASTYSLRSYDGLLNPGALAAIKKAIFQAAHQLPGCCLVVKPHPMENLREITNLARGFENLVFADAQSDIRELIKACDAFVTLGSTATLDALIAGKLVICPAFSGWVLSDVFVHSKAALVPRTPEEVAQCLYMVVNGSRDNILADLEAARQRFLKQWVYGADGQAAARVENLAMEMARSCRDNLE